MTMLLSCIWQCFYTLTCLTYLTVSSDENIQDIRVQVDLVAVDEICTTSTHAFQASVLGEGRDDVYSFERSSDFIRVGDLTSTQTNVSMEHHVFSSNQGHALMEIQCDEKGPLYIGVLSLKTGKCFTFGVDKPSQNGQKLKPTTQDNHDVNKRTGYTSARTNEGQWRTKRSVSDGDIFLDTLVIVGYSVYKRWMERNDVNVTEGDLRRQIEEYFVLMIGGVDRRFKTASHELNIKLAGIHIQTDGDGDWLNSAKVVNGNQTIVYGVSMLRTVSDWTTSSRFLPEHDVVLAYESLDLYARSTDNISNVFSYRSVACVDKSRSVVVISYQDLLAVDMFNTASGFAFTLGATSDGQGNNCSSSDRYLMTDMSNARYINTSYHFSSCSARDIDDYIKSAISRSNESKSCFLDTVDNVNISSANYSGVFPGEVYSPDEQCIHHYGLGSYYCHNVGDPDHSGVCLNMYCYVPGTTVCYQKYAAEGTTCGGKKWCMGGECVYADEAPDTNDRCVYGDQAYIGLLNNKRSCKEFTKLGNYYCYSEAYRVACCTTCRRVKEQQMGCEYGDNLLQAPLCSIDNCLSNINNQAYLDACCDTCRNISFYTTSATSPPTTTTVFITTQILATTTVNPLSSTNDFTTTATTTTYSTEGKQETTSGTTTEKSLSTSASGTLTERIVMKDTETDSAGLAAGLSIGLIVAILLILLTVFYYLKKKSTRVKPSDLTVEAPGSVPKTSTQLI